MLHPVTVVFASAALSYAVTFILTRRIHISFWSFFGTFLYEWPKLLYMFGASSLETLIFFNYTFGVVVIPFLLVILNFIFNQLNMFVKLRFLFRLVPRKKKGLINKMKMAIFFHDGIKLLQRYNILPKHEEARKVYLAGVVAGLARLSVFLYSGL